jgi:hypothetical protein
VKISKAGLVLSSIYVIIWIASIAHAIWLNYSTAPDPWNFTWPMLLILPWPAIPYGDILFEKQFMFLLNAISIYFISWLIQFIIKRWRHAT